ncbi:protein-S-isoprenylcysteine O-methyltransferase Ste14 [Paracoccus lutimaris]|uniref:Protein-S-isoprenylcysteine O-methyltransferase Ste14 n=1 Tax=Paracoccus lutimaris TaxID=1490030 RepID=A0A368YT84_9RHOB|nr:protein-S-isoprenylcysteine O-methyltransferase Ste14 [Paracoccus lutimaris]
MPQVWLLPFALAGLALGRIFPFGPSPPMRGGGLFLVALALGLMLWAALTMRAARTTVMPGRRPEHLVTNGPFRFSRNPIYLGDLIGLAGLMLALDAPAGLLVVPGFALLLEHRFIRQEEAVIAAAFGPAYEDYRSRVRRWI